MRTLLVLFLAFTFFHEAKAADPDSLVTAYKMASTANERAGLAYAIANKYLFNDIKLAEKYLRASIHEAPQITDKSKLGNLYSTIGVYYYLQASHDSALLSFDKGITQFTAANDLAGVNKCIKNSGLAYTGKGDYPAAIKVYLKALEYFRTQKDTLVIVKTITDLGNTYSFLKNHEQALKFQREALTYLKRYKNPGLLGNVYNSIGYIFDDKEQADSAIYYYTKSLALKEKYGNLRSVLTTKNNICNCIDSEKKSAESITCFTELLALQQKADDKPGIVRSYSNISVAHRNAGNYAKAMEALAHAEKHAKALDDAVLIAQLLSKKAEVERLMGDYQKANQDLQTYLAVKDSFFYTDRNKETIELAAKYELAKKETELSEGKRKLLQTENEKLQANLAVEQRNYWLMALALLLAGGSFTTVAALQRTRTRQQKEKARAVLEERDRGLKAIIDAQEEERIRIARELHDGVGNQLLALKMSMNQVVPLTNHHETDQVNKLLTDVMDEVRSVSHQMMPKVLQEFGIVPALQDMLEKTLGTAGIKFEFDTHNLQPRYEQRLETALFRVTQELVNNIIKHSGATFASLQLLETNNTLVLFLEDNGRGIGASKTEKPKDGIGITSVKSRISAINGEMNIVPGESSGTVVTIRIPVS